MENKYLNTHSNVLKDLELFNSKTEHWVPRERERVRRAIIKHRYPYVKIEILAELLGVKRGTYQKTIRDHYDFRIHESAYKKAWKAALEIFGETSKKGAIDL